MSAEKVSLTLCHGQSMSVETLAALFEKMTGRKPTPDELDRARAQLALTERTGPK